MMLKNCTPEIVEQLNRVTQETFITQDITELVWDNKKRIMTYGSNSIKITKEELETKAKQKPTKQIQVRAVHVRMINMKWFYKNGKAFTTFAKITGV